MATGRPNGRPPKPIEVKQAERRTKNGIPEARTPQGVKEVPSPPSGLSAASKKTWEGIWTSNPHLKDQDLFIMTLFIQTWEDYVFYVSEIKAADKQVKATGNLIHSKRIHVNSNGTQQSHAYFSQLKETKIQLNTYMSSLGLTPADRARLFLDAEAQSEREDIREMFTRKPKEL